MGIFSRSILSAVRAICVLFQLSYFCSRPIWALRVIFAILFCAIWLLALTRCCLSNKSWSVESCLIMQITEATAASRPLQWSIEPRQAWQNGWRRNSLQITLVTDTVGGMSTTKAPRLTGKKPEVWNWGTVTKNGLLTAFVAQMTRL